MIAISECIDQQKTCQRLAKLYNKTRSEGELFIYSINKIT
jgi:hypothetical protein